MGKLMRAIIEREIEHCWLLVGGKIGRVWWARRKRETSGHTCSVAFDYNYVLKQEEDKGNVVGFYHTHPSFYASPSDLDHRTMRAWVVCFGKPLACLIHGVDGLKAYWYINDESPPVELLVKQIGNIVFGLCP